METVIFHLPKTAEECAYRWAVYYDPTNSMWASVYEPHESLIGVYSSEEDAQQAAERLHDSKGARSYVLDLCNGYDSWGDGGPLSPAQIVKMAMDDLEGYERNKTFAEENPHNALLSEIANDYHKRLIMWEGVIEQIPAEQLSAGQESLASRARISHWEI